MGKKMVLPKKIDEEIAPTGLPFGASVVSLIRGTDEKTGRLVSIRGNRECRSVRTGDQCR